MDADPVLVKHLKETLLQGVSCPGKGEVWQTNRARELIKVHALIPELRKRHPDPDQMKFATLGSSDNENNLPRKLISSSSLALSRVFPTKPLQENRKVVQDALLGLRRELKKGSNWFQEHMDGLETKFLGKPRHSSPPHPLP